MYSLWPTLRYTNRSRTRSHQGALAALRTRYLRTLVAPPAFALDVNKVRFLQWLHSWCRLRSTVEIERVQRASKRDARPKANPQRWGELARSTASGVNSEG